MTYSYLVITPQGKLGVSDSQAGENVLYQLFKQYGDLIVEVRDHEQVFGKGLDYGEPITTVKIKDILQGEF